MFVRREGFPRPWALRLGAFMFGLLIAGLLPGGNLSPASARIDAPPDGPVLPTSMFPAGLEARLVSVETNGDTGYTYWRWEVDSGCIYGDHTYHFNFSGDTFLLHDAELSMGNEDVDWNDPQGCADGSEVDMVHFNDAYLGNLSGANDSWSLNEFKLGYGLIQPGQNTLFIDTDATGSGCWCVGVSYIEIRARVGFQVTKITPKYNDVNRDFHKDKLDLTVQFSMPFDQATVNENTFVLKYRNTGGGYTHVPGAFEFLDGRTFKFIPNADLLGGVRYYAEVIAGDNGIQTVTGGNLEHSYTWFFFTAVDLTLKDNFEVGGYSICGASPKPCDALELHIIQTERNAPILPDKPAVARIYTRWNKHNDVHPSEQIVQTEFDIRLTGPGGVTATLRKPIARWDYYAGQNRLGKGDHTYILPFTPQDGGLYKVELVPTPQTNAIPLRFEATRTVAAATGTPRIEFYYHFVKGGDWAGGVPDNARQDGLSDFTAGSRLVTDQFPTYTTGFNVSPDVPMDYTFTGNTVSTASCGTVREVNCNFGSGSIITNEPRCIDVKASMIFRGGPFVAVTAPAAACPNVTAYEVSNYRLLVHFAGSPANDITVAHEIGHVFGLSAANEGAPNHRVTINGTEGWSVRSGKNFSYNENPGGFQTLMHPVTNVAGLSWIHGADYADLLNGSTARAAIQASDPPYLMVNGVVDLDTNSAMINPLLLLDEPSVLNVADPAGICQAALLDGASNPLQQITFNPGFSIVSEKNPLAPGAAGRPGHWRSNTLDDSGPQPVNLHLPWNAAAASLRLTCNGVTLLNRSRSAAAPTINFTNVAENAVLSGIQPVNWSASDANGDPVRVQVQISYNGGTNWVALSELLGGNSFSLDSAKLVSGSGLKLRLAATDGFNTAFAVRTVSISNPLRVVSASPRNSQTGVQSTTDIAVTFSAPINPATLPGALTLADGAVSLVPVTFAGYDPVTRTATYRPDRPLMRASATARILASVQDTNGNPLPADHVWGFTVAEPGAPYVEEISPGEDAQDVPTNAYIQVKLSERLYFFSVTTASFYVSGPGGNVAGATEVRDRSDPNGHRRTYLFFNPTAPLQPNTTYTVHLTGAIQDANGTAMLPAQFSFTTGEGGYTGNARTTGRITDQLVDTNADGVAEILRFLVEIEVRTIASYNVNAGLRDKNGQLMEWGYDERSLSPGVYWIPLDFPAGVVAAGAGGPFELHSMSVYNSVDYMHPAAWIPPYTTLPYRPSVFGGIDADNRLKIYLPLTAR